MRLSARDHEAFYHLIGLLVEAGVDATPLGGNELMLPDDATIGDLDILAELARVVVPGTLPAAFALPPPGGGGATPAPASADLPALAEAPAINPPAAPAGTTDREMMGPTAVPRPPSSGPGSGQQAQVRYALGLGIDNRDNGDGTFTPVAQLSRDELVALLDQHENPGGQQ